MYKRLTLTYERASNSSFEQGSESQFLIEIYGAAVQPSSAGLCSLCGAKRRNASQRSGGGA